VGWVPSSFLSLSNANNFYGYIFLPLQIIFYSISHFATPSFFRVMPPEDVRREEEARILFLQCMFLCGLLLVITYKAINVAVWISTFAIIGTSVARAMRVGYDMHLYAFAACCYMPIIAQGYATEDYSVAVRNLAYLAISAVGAYRWRL